MKRLFVLAAAALSLTLFSFVAPENGADNTTKKFGQGTNGITRIGDHDFMQTNAARFTAAEQAVFDKLTQERYHMKNVRLGAGSTIELESTERAFFIYRRRVHTENRFTEQTLIGSSLSVADPTLQAAEAILAKYADAK
jgi:hypothetical protein